MRKNNIQDMTITEQIENVKEQICDKYCKFPELSEQTIDDPDEAFEWLQHNHCNDCPLNRL